MEWLLGRILASPNAGLCYRVAEILIQRRGFAAWSDHRTVVVREPVMPEGHRETVSFRYLPGPRGQGIVLHRGSTVGVRGIKL